MTEPDTADAPRSAAVRTAIVVLGPLVILFMIAFIAGMIVAGSEHEGPHSLAYYGVLLVAAVIALAAVWVVWRNLAAFRLPVSPRMRKSRMMLYICLALGLVIGIALGIAEGRNRPARWPCCHLRRQSRPWLRQCWRRGSC